MMKFPMSVAAAGLLRSMLARAGDDQDRILLIESQSTEWQSLTFVGERHQMSLRIIGPGANEIVERLTTGLGEGGPPWHEIDGSMTIDLEALTIAE
jgi:hypothetical protein